MRSEQVCSERTESVLLNACVKNEKILKEYPMKQEKCAREHESEGQTKG